MVTIFKDIFDKENPQYRSVDFVLSLIRDGKSKDKIHQLRQEEDKATRERIKRGLISICFSGQFKKRFDSEIIKHSGFVILDFDHVDLSLKDKICKDEYTYATFISPSGDGLKVLFRIPADIKKHEAHYLGIVKHCKDRGYPELDITSKNISRVCFISYDPELYINKDSKIFTDIGRVEQKERYIEMPAQTTDYKKLDVIASMVRNSRDGEKHIELVRAARLAGGFISGGLIEEVEAVRVLELEINRKDIKDFKSAAKTISKCIEYGKRDPIQEQNWKARLKKIIEEDIIIEDEPARDVVFLDDVRDKIKYSYKHGVSRGETTHYPEIDKIYRMKRGEVTLIHGIANHGKSEMIRQLMLIKSVYDGYKWGVFSPEDMPVEEFYKNLISTFIGKSTEPHHTNQMNSDELERGMNFIKDHFFLIYPKDEAPTPKYINNRFRELIIKHSIDGCAIDPYNQLDNDISKTGGREDQYLSRFLTECKRFAVEHNMFYFIVAHPRGNLSKDGMDYEMPNVYDLSGGAMWNNKCDNILVHHRPRYTTDKKDESCIFASQKIKKQKLNGIPGDVNLRFSRYESRFKQLNNEYTPLDDKSKTEPEQGDFWCEKHEEAPF